MTCPTANLRSSKSELVDEASAARTIAELEHEIATLTEPGRARRPILRTPVPTASGRSCRACCSTSPEMFDAPGNRRKLIIFSEHRDTLNYLMDKLRALLGRAEAVVAIHGGMPREERRKVQEAFTQDKDVLVLVGNRRGRRGHQPAAGPPDGQLRPAVEPEPDRAALRAQCTASARPRSATCGTSSPTTLAKARSSSGCSQKLDEQRKALGGQVFDVLGEAFRGQSLRDLLIQAIRYGEQPRRPGPAHGGRRRHCG